MLLNVNDVQEILNLPQSTAYAVIRRLNAELDEQGFLTIRGRVEKDYLLERFRMNGKEVGDE